jgi:phosphomevalonate kinase
MLSCVTSFLLNENCANLHTKEMLATMATSTATAAATTTDRTVVVSAPGKLLLVGGYLVLEEGNVGIPIGVDARFYASCTLRETATTTAAAGGCSTLIRVISPQFDYCEWNYEWDATRSQLAPAAASTTTAKPNPFIEKALRVALLYLDSSCPSVTDSTATIHRTVITLEIVADNDFYSLVPHLQARNLPCTYEAATSALPKRLPAAINPTTGSIYKTGLGSSACLVTALTGALVHAFAPSGRFPFATTAVGDFDEDDQMTTTIARLSQIGHCYAQGKVGSGFDVSAACYGSHVYQRFAAATLAPILTRLDADHQNDTATTARLLRDTVHDETQWRNAGVVAPLHCFTSNSLLQVIMADVSGGSESPSMAKQVLQWRAAQQQAGNSDTAAVPHWDDLVRLNQHVVQVLQQIYSVQPMADAAVQQALIDHQDVRTGWTTYLQGNNDNTKENVCLVLASLLQDLRTSFQSIRHHLKAMGEAAMVPIEPDVQTALCDACQSIPGVVAALVPGAGGYDAVACLYINTSATRHAVAELWATWKGGNSGDDSTEVATNVCALTVSGVDYGAGVRVEPEFPPIACPRPGDDTAAAD